MNNSVCGDSFFGDECGTGGFCDGTRCVCKEGWEQSLDFMYFVGDRVSDTERVLAAQPCDQNTLGRQLIYSSILALFLWIAAAHLFIIKRKSQLKRLIPFFLSCLSYVTLAGFKLAQPTRFIGTDALVTFLLAVPFFFVNFSNLVFFNKYIHFQQKMAKLKPNIRRQMRVYKRTQRVVFLGDLCISVFMVCFIFVEGSAAEILMYLMFGIFTLRSVYALIAANVFVNMMIGDMRPSKYDATFTKKLEDRIRSLRKVKFHIIWHTSLRLLLSTPVLFYKEWLLLVKYIFPMVIALSAVMTTLLLFNYNKAMIIKKFVDAKNADKLQILSKQGKKPSMYLTSRKTSNFFGTFRKKSSLNVSHIAPPSPVDTSTSVDH